MRVLLIVAMALGVSTAHAAPEIHVRIASVTDAAERAAHVELVKRSLRDLNARTIDVIVSKLVIAANGDVTAKIEVVLSNSGGMRSVATGSAAFTAPKHQLRNAVALRREALGYALKALRQRVL